MSEEKAKEAKKDEAKEQEDTGTSKVKSLLEENPAGMTAEELAIEMGLMKEGDPSGVKRNALKKVRIYARKATDGAAAKKKGRTAIYQLDPSVPTGREEEPKPKKKKAKAEKAEAKTEDAKADSTESKPKKKVVKKKATA